MKKLLLLLTILPLISCQNKKENQENSLKDLQKEAQEYMKNRIDFFIDAKPKYFTAKTLNGKLFNSQDYTGKNLIIFIYSDKLIQKDEQSSYDLQDDFNDLYKNYNGKVNFIGILEGFVETDKNLEHILKDIHLPFEQIDNTQSYNKENQINYNIYCTPAKILIDINGKVIVSSCGGAVNNELIKKLDSIKNYR